MPPIETTGIRCEKRGWNSCFEILSECIYHRMLYGFLFEMEFKKKNYIVDHLSKEYRIKNGKVKNYFHILLSFWLCSEVLVIIKYKLYSIGCNGVLNYTVNRFRNFVILKNASSYHSGDSPGDAIPRRDFL